MCVRRLTSNMDNNTTNMEVVEKITNVIKCVEGNDFKVMFFVTDSQNVPNSSLTYIYQLAQTMKELGYNVEMLYQIEREYSEFEWAKLVANGEEMCPENKAKHFFGVQSWLGEKYARLPHTNIANGTLQVGPQDFLFIPEAFSSLMKETKRLYVPCKRYVILQNFNYVTDFIPVGDSWATYGIANAICTTPRQEQLIKGVFDYVKTTVLPPYISKEFRKTNEPKKLIVNVVCKTPEMSHRIAKPFYWKYPIYGFVSFREIGNLPKKEFAKALQETPITVWLNEDTQFGYSALEAIRCGNIVIGLQPKDDIEWTNVENGCILTYDINNIPEILCNVIGSWMRDGIPAEITEGMEKINKMYTFEEWKTNVTKLIGSMKEERIAELESFKNNVIKENNDEEGK